MKTLSLARVLPVLNSFESQQFGPPRSETPRPDLHIVESFGEETDAPFAEDRAELDQRQWQEGYEAGVSVGRAQAQTEMFDQDVLLRDAVSAARAEWLAQESERIAAGVEKALGHIEGEICAVATRILAQIVCEAKRAGAVTEFTAHIRKLLRDGEAGLVTVHAPDDLVEDLAQRLGFLGVVEFVAHDGAEVWVRSGATMIEARLDQWRLDHFSEE